MFNKSGKSRHLCSVPHIRGIAFSFSLLSVLLAVGLSYMAFIILGYVPSMPTLLFFPWCFQYFLLVFNFCQFDCDICLVFVAAGVWFLLMAVQRLLVILVCPWELMSSHSTICLHLPSYTSGIWLITFILASSWGFLEIVWAYFYKYFELLEKRC